MSCAFRKANSSMRTTMSAVTSGAMSDGPRCSFRQEEAQMIFKVFSSLFLSLAIPISLIAQTDPAAGILPFSTQAVGIYESVDLATSNINLTIPIRQKTGKIPLSFTLGGNSHAYIYQPAIEYSPTAWGVNSGLGLQALAALAGPAESSNKDVTCSGGAHRIGHWSSYYSVVDPTGANHRLPLFDVWEGLPAGCEAAPPTTTTIDGSGYTVVPTAYTSNSLVYYGFTVYDKFNNASGYFATPGIVVQDSDGADISVSSSCTDSTCVFTYTDTLGATALTLTSNISSGSSSEYQYTDASGNTQTFQLNYSSYTQQTVFGCNNSAGSPVSDIQPTSVYLPSTITTPTGTITLTYETTPGDTHNPHYVTGRLASLTYLSGGSVTYTYSGGNN